MDYSLSATRKIGKYRQKVIITQSGTPKTDSVAKLNELKGWQSLLDGVNSDAWGSPYNFSETGFMETESSGTTNNGALADVTLCVRTTTTNPNITTFSVKNVTQQTMVSEIISNYNRLVGVTLPNANYFVISILVVLKKGS